MELRWKKSSKSGPAGHCVEVRQSGDGAVVQVRHSQELGDGILTYTREEWAAFVAGVKDGEFDV